MNGADRVADARYKHNVLQRVTTPHTVTRPTVTLLVNGADRVADARYKHNVLQRYAQCCTEDDCFNNGGDIHSFITPSSVLYMLVAAIAE